MARAGCPGCRCDPVGHRGGLQRIRQHEPAARQGEVDGVHRMRIRGAAAQERAGFLSRPAGRRPGQGLNRELKWLGRVLGAVRDWDVMRDRLRQAAGDLAVDLGPLFTALAERHAAASVELREALEGERFGRLPEQLSETAEQASFRGDAWEPSGRVLPALARKAWKRLRSAARSLDLADADEAYHDVRKRAKRAATASSRSF